MKAATRLGMAIWAAALGLVPLAAHAQSDPPPVTSDTPVTPPGDSVGPRDLRDFSINGTVTRAATPPPAAAAPAPAPRPPATTTQRAAPVAATPSSAPATASPAPARAAPRPALGAPDLSAATPAPVPTPLPSDSLGSSVTQTLPPADSSVVIAPPAASEPPGGRSLLPWLVLAALIAAGGVYAFWRQRARAEFAGGDGRLAYAAPEPTPTPTPMPAPTLARRPTPAPVRNPPGSSPLPAGIVSTRLRPWLEIAFAPTRCIIEDEQATIEFDVDLYNSGSAPARDVLVEGAMFNAGPAQDQEVGAFFANPVAQGDRIPAIPPLSRYAVKSAVTLPRDQMRPYDAAGRMLFVPLIAFNALYRWSGSEGQTSSSYLVGRDAQGDRMAPLRLDQGAREYRGLAAREQDLRVRS